MKQNWYAPFKFPNNTNNPKPSNLNTLDTTSMLLFQCRLTVSPAGVIPFTIETACSNFRDSFQTHNTFLTGLLWCCAVKNNDIFES